MELRYFTTEQLIINWRCYRVKFLKSGVLLELIKYSSGLQIFKLSIILCLKPREIILRKIYLIKNLRQFTTS